MYIGMPFKPGDNLRPQLPVNRMHRAANAAVCDLAAHTRTRTRQPQTAVRRKASGERGWIGKSRISRHLNFSRSGMSTKEAHFADSGLTILNPNHSRQARR